MTSMLSDPRYRTVYTNPSDQKIALALRSAISAMTRADRDDSAKQLAVRDCERALQLHSEAAIKRRRQK